MDVEGPVVVEADSSERPDGFVLESNGTSEDALGECWGICGVAEALIGTNILKGSVGG